MENTESSQSFVHEWLKIKKCEKKFNQAIIEAIEQSLGGLMNEELDESNLLKLLQMIENGGDNG